MNYAEIKARLWEQIVSFARTELRDTGQVSATTRSFPRQLWDRCGSFGIQGLSIPKHDGGLGYTASETAIVLEALGYGCNNNGLLASLAAHLLGCLLPIWKFGNEEQKRRYLPSLCNGSWIAAHGATEQQAGSDIFHLQTTAKRTEHGYVLNGTKTYILNAPVANILVVFATVDPERGQEGITAFIVERETPGISVARTIETMGLQHALMGVLNFDNCLVPLEQRLGKEGAGPLIFQFSMGWERSLILASHLGTMRRVLEKCVSYARQREQFGQQIGRFQSVSNLIADMKVRIEAGSLLLYQAADLLDRGKPNLLEAATAKLFLSESAVATYLDAIRIHGALGYTHDVEFAHDLQDAIGTLILSGTSDMQRQIIARLLGV